MADERALLLAMGTHSPYVHQLFYHLFKDNPSVHYAAHKEMRASVCQKCGDPGFKELLVHCKKCKISAEHRYCLDKFPKPEERVHWFCEQCEPSSTFASLGKLVVCNARSNDDLKCSDQQKDFSEIPRHQDKRQATSYNGGTVSKVPNRRDKSRMSSSCNKVVPLHKMQNDGTSGSEHKKFQNDVKIHPCTSPKKDGGQKLKRRRRLLLQEDPTDHELLSDNVEPIELPPATVFALPPPHIISCDEIVQEKVHDNQPNMQCNQAPSDQHLYSVAQPIIDPVWRGHIYFGDEKYGPWTAHASTIACGRVFTAAKLLPAVLQMEKLPRLLFCPNSFKNAPPTDDKIGLYFFPGGTKVDRVLDQFLDDVIHKDFLFRFMFDEAELLVFSSSILHQNHQKFRGKYYLWGAFRGRQAAVSSSYANCHSRPTEPGVDSRGMKVSYEHAGEKEEGEGHDNDSSELSNFTLSPLSVLSHPPRSNELREDPPRSEDTSKLAADRGGVEANDKEEQEDYELEEGEIYEGHAEREKGDDPEEYVEGEDGDSPEDSAKLGRSCSARAATPAFASFLSTTYFEKSDDTGCRFLFISARSMRPGGSSNTCSSATARLRCSNRIHHPRPQDLEPISDSPDVSRGLTLTRTPFSSSPGPSDRKAWPLGLCSRRVPLQSHCHTFRPWQNHEMRLPRSPRLTISTPSCWNPTPPRRRRQEIWPWRGRGPLAECTPSTASSRQSARLQRRGPEGRAER